MIDVTENIVYTSALDNYHCSGELETNFNAVKKLFGPLRVATTGSCVVIAQSLWQRIEPVALLPAILHGPSADALNFLSLNASFTLFPFTQADWATVQSSIFDIEAVHYSRKCARRNRYQENRAHQRDLEPPDWEIGYENNRDELYGKRLSATSFLSIESIQPGGNARHHPRPVIGRYTTRRSQRGGWCPPRPELLIAGRHCTSAAEAAIRKLINTDVLIVNLQQLYGRRSLSLARALLAARGPQRPTLIISSRPSELVFFDSLDLLEQATAIPLGSSLGTPQVETVLVGRERPQYEREYEILLRQLKGVSPVHDYLVQMGIRAWWSANQALNDDVTNDSSVYRFLSALDQRASSNGDEATDFKAFRRLLLQILGNHRRIEERTEAISNLVFEHLNCGHGDIVIIVRTPTSVKVVTEWLANQLECRLFELEEWGIFVTTARVLTANDHIGLTIACGFSGVTSLDALLSTRATLALRSSLIRSKLPLSSAVLIS